MSGGGTCDSHRAACVIERQTPKRSHHQCRVFGSPWPGVFAVRTESDRTFGRHFHATYGIGLMEHGAQSSASARGNVSAYMGDLIASDPGEVHDGRPLGAPSRRWRMIYLDTAMVASMAAPDDGATEVELTRPVIQDVPLRAALIDLFDRLHRWTVHPSTPDDALACEESLVRTCRGLLMRHANAAAPAAAVSTDMSCVRDRLADELLNPPTLTELAGMVGLSKYQLLRRFASVYGLPPHAWLQQQRAELVRRLIRGGHDLASAALAVGYADQSHMSRKFMQHFGFTPGAWQRAAGRGWCLPASEPAPQ